MPVSRCGSGVSGSAWGTPCPTTPSVTLERKLGSPSAVRSIRSSRTSAASAAGRSAPELEAAMPRGGILVRDVARNRHGVLRRGHAAGRRLGHLVRTAFVHGRRAQRVGAPCGSFASTGMGPGGRLVTPTTTLEMPCATRSLRPPPATAPLAPADRGVPKRHAGRPSRRAPSCAC